MIYCNKCSRFNPDPSVYLYSDLVQLLSTIIVLLMRTSPWYFVIHTYMYFFPERRGVCTQAGLIEKEKSWD